MDADAHADRANLKDEEEFLISVENTLSTVKDSIHDFAKDVPQVLADCELDFDSKKFCIDDEQKEEISTLELECERLRAQLQHQIQANKKSQEEIQYLKEQTLNQSIYCSTLGAVLGSLTWRASRFPEIVDIWLSAFQHKISELLSMTAGSFVAFINTYRNAFPPTSNVEYQFLIGLLGIVTNISAGAEGREFLITDPNGRGFVEKMVKLMPTLPFSQGSLTLERLMLMTFYNVSMNKTGLRCLLELRVGDALNYCLKNNSLPDEIQLLCLRVLHSITYDLTNSKYIRDLITTLPISKIEDIAAANKSKTSTVAKQIIKQLRDSQKCIDSN